MLETYTRSMICNYYLVICLYFMYTIALSTVNKSAITLVVQIKKNVLRREEKNCDVTFNVTICLVSLLTDETLSCHLMLANLCMPIPGFHVK